MVLVREEMRRCLVFLDARAQWWRAQGQRRQNVSDDILSGLKAYAEKQARLFEDLAADFAREWLTTVADVGLASPLTWPQKFLHISPITRQVRRRRNRNKLVVNALSYTHRKNSDMESD